MKSVIAGLVGFCVATVTALLAGLAGGLTHNIAALAFTLGGIAVFAAWSSLRDLSEGEPIRGWAAWGSVVAFALFALRAFCWLIYPQGGDLSFFSPNNLGDLSLHLTYIQYFANGAPFWPQNPIYAAAPLHYPFGVDLFNSLLTLANVDLVRGLVWVGLLGALATGVMLWRWGGAFTLAGFLFNGGLAGFALFATGQFADFQDKLDWKCIPLALFVTQRGLLYAIPAGLALLWSWRARLLRGGRGLPLWIEVLLYSTLPLFHLHTFIFLSLLLGAWLLVPASQGAPAPRREIVRLGLLSFAPASALIYELTGGFQSGGMIHFTRAWMGEKDGALRFWVENFGALPLVLAALLIWLLRRRKRPETLELIALVVPSLLFFLITFRVMFAAWDWDNTKLMLWAYLAVLPAIWAMLREEPLWIRFAICAALFFSGAVSMIGGLNANHGGYPLANRAELDQLAVPLRKIPITATFACLPTYNHSLLLLGRKVVAGYDGHLMSHGIPYQARYADLESLLRGESGWQERARQLGVDYLFWGDRERQKYGNATPWAATAPLVAEGSWGRIYDLRGLRSESANAHETTGIKR